MKALRGFNAGGEGPVSAVVPDEARGGCEDPVLPTLLRLRRGACWATCHLRGGTQSLDLCQTGQGGMRAEEKALNGGTSMALFSFTRRTACLHAANLFASGRSLSSSAIDIHFSGATNLGSSSSSPFGDWASKAGLPPAHDDKRPSFGAPAEAIGDANLGDTMHGTVKGAALGSPRHEALAEVVDAAGVGDSMQLPIHMRAAVGLYALHLLHDEGWPQVAPEAKYSSAA
eukprot:CAMPEP_0170614316 /NCGR_PEP_ID=MMETSP0224-20130122/24734_1 /TAXON_ID=285029 /ORGANISM="Togula jolla, Strain CCCM 725" /LENGTH=228 /DNA_ID=CAMNT_0010939963 /DNA_START=132 /DNA_END=818 /DNA_ORIENTATION=+